MSRHQFAPLSAGSSTVQDDAGPTMRLQGIVFDMDGTLCEPQNHMFGEMRAALGIDKSTDILDHMHSLPQAEQEQAFGKIQAIERRAMAEQVPQKGLHELLSYLDEKGVRRAICTRNFDAPVTHLVTKHVPAHLEPFFPIVTREFRPPKPSPAGILHIAKAWNVVDSSTVPEEVLPLDRPLPLVMVGDSVDDMAAGRDAGALTVLLRSDGKEELEMDARTDVVISRLDELIGLLEHGLTVRHQLTR